MTSSPRSTRLPVTSLPIVCFIFEMKFKQYNPPPQCRQRVFAITQLVFNVRDSLIFINDVVMGTS